MYTNKILINMTYYHRRIILNDYNLKIKMKIETLSRFKRLKCVMNDNMLYQFQETTA